MSDRLKMPPNRDFKFYQRRKHDKWREVALPGPVLEASVADSHAHIHMLPDPAWELARCAANGVDYVCMIVDPSEDGSRPFDELPNWEREAERDLAGCEQAGFAAATESAMPMEPASAAKSTMLLGFATPTKPAAARPTATTEFAAPVEPAAAASPTAPTKLATPMVRIAAGVHPHNAKLYDEAIERELMVRLGDHRVVALGEIGLDYHYDLSPRDVQRRVFRRQIALAKEAGLPIALHLRGGDDQQADNAHAEAFDILQEEGFPEKGTLLHCCALSPDELRPWVESGCYIAYGGALTFKNAGAAREGARLVPADRLLLETDAPYMTPEPMRGAACTPAHVVFTAVALAEIRGIEAGSQRQAFLRQVFNNTLAFYGGCK